MPLNIDQALDIDSQPKPQPAPRRNLTRAQRLAGSKKHSAQKRRDPRKPQITVKELRKAVEAARNTATAPKVEFVQPDTMQTEHAPSTQPVHATRGIAPLSPRAAAARPDNVPATHAPDASARPDLRATPGFVATPGPTAPRATWMQWLRHNLLTCVQQIKNADLVRNPWVQSIVLGALIGVAVGTCLPVGLLAESVFLTQVACKVAGMGIAAALRYLYENPFVGVCALAGAVVAFGVATVTCGAGVVIGLLAGLGGAAAGGCAGHKLSHASEEMKMVILFVAMTTMANTALGVA